MGSDKQRYDITMSRRTRRPLNVMDENENSPRESPPREAARIVEENERRSLKQLIDGAGSGGDEGGEGRSSLGQHFMEGEKQLQLVGVQQKGGLHGLKLKKMVSRYAKVLGFLIKKKRDPSLRNSKKNSLPKLIF